MHREPSFFRRLVHSVALTVCTLVVIVALVAGGAWLASQKQGKVDKGAWLVLDLYGEVHEYDPPGGPLGAVMGGDALTLQDMLDNLGKAARDKRIKGVIFHVSASNSCGFAKLQELRGAVDRVQAAGKPVYAWADALDLPSLWLAAGCDKVMMPTGGYVSFTGLHRQRVYVRAMLDKLGIVPHLHKIKDYKAAAEMIMDTHASEAAKANMNWLMDDVWETLLADLGRERGLDRDALYAAMTYAEFMPDEARAAGLIDETIYLPELEDRLREDGDKQLKTVDHETYAKVAWKDVGGTGGGTVAVVHAQGNIGGRENRVDPLMGIMMGHESISRELERCRLDDKVKAVVFRIDSGGGESLASDLMCHEVERLAAEKPVVVSMVDVAASGGYYIAYKGTKLMADPLTVTGSIGSINGFFNMKGFYDRIGVNKDGIARGPMAELGTDMRDPTPEEWARHTEAHWIGFNAWLADVARVRGLEFEKAETLAHGRTWTGTQAVANGLIDQVGDLEAAVALAAELGGLKADRRPDVVHLPERQGLLASLMGQDGGADDPVAAALRAAVVRGLRAQVRETGAFLQDGAAAVVRP